MVHVVILTYELIELRIPNQGSIRIGGTHLVSIGHVQVTAGALSLVLESGLGTYRFKNGSVKTAVLSSGRGSPS